MYPTPTEALIKLGPTEQAIVEQVGVGGQNLQQYYTGSIIIFIGSIALLIVFWVWVYLNRENIRRWLKGWLNK